MYQVFLSKIVAIWQSKSQQSVRDLHLFQWTFYSQLYDWYLPKCLDKTFCFEGLRYVLCREYNLLKPQYTVKYDHNSY